MSNPDHNHPPLWQRLTIEHLWALAILACIWAFVATHPIRPHDFWWHLEIGREIVQTGQVPTHDTFSYTAPGAPYPSYRMYWLAEQWLYRIYAAGGPALSVFVHSLVITLTYGLLLALCWRLSRSGRVAALCTLAAAACGFENWNLRPQAIAFLLGAVYLTLIYAYRRRPNLSRWWLLVFPLAMVPWVNSHGSFPLGLILLGFWLLDTLWERLRGREAALIAAPVTALVLSALAMAMDNAFQGNLLAYLRAMANNPIVQRLPEWAPASLATKDGIAFFVVLGLSAVALSLSWRRLRLFEVLCFIFFALLAWKTGRAIVWFGLAVAPVLAEVLPGLLPKSEGATKPPNRAERVINIVLATGLVALMVFTLPRFKDRLPLPEQKAGLISSETPVAATEYLLKHRLPPRVFHDMAYGSYLIWAAQPQYKVFVDPRIELYPETIWEQYEALSAGERGWEESLRRRGVNTLMLDLKLQAGLVKAAAASPRWREVYRDGHTVILVRR
jgi:hypothetical protein